jgi:TP901 family phage tail tape measure protein
VNQELRAGLRLDLEDKLSNGLSKLEKQMDRLVNLAKKLGLGDLEKGLDVLQRLAGPIDEVVDGLRSTEQQADRATAAITRMAAAANESIISVNSGGIASLNRSLGQLVTLGNGARGGDVSEDPPGAGGSPLLLGGPGGDSRIPLNLQPDRIGNLRRAGGNFVDAAHAAGSAAQDGISQGFVGIMEGAGMAHSIGQYAAYENILRHIAISEKLSGDKVAPEIKRLNQLFVSDAHETGQTSESIARAYSDLVQQGISARVVNVALLAHSKAATAYNISPEDLGAATGSLLGNAQIPEGQIGGALAAMAYASKEGRFKVEDFSRQLPGITGQMELLGMTGRGSADIAFASLETVMKNSSQPNQGAANFFDALHYITSPIANRSFAKQAGIDLPKLLRNAEKQGINPLYAVLGKLDQRTAGMGHIDKTEFIGKLLHNQEAGTAIVSLLEHKAGFLDLKKRLDAVGKDTLDTDFATGFAAPLIQLRKVEEDLAELNRTLGESLLPMLKAVAVALWPITTALNYMNEHFPVTTHVILGTVAGLLALAAIVTVVTAVMPAVIAVWGLLGAGLGFVAAGLAALMSPITWIVGAVSVFEALGAVLAAIFSPIGLVIAAVALLAAAAYDVYENWGTFAPFFEELWSGVKMSFQGFLDFFAGIFTLDMDRVWKGLGEMGSGFGMQMHASWDIVKQIFNDFVTWVDSWSGGLGTRILAGISSGWQALVDGLHALVERMEKPLEDSWLGRHFGLADAAQLTAVHGASGATPPAAAGAPGAPAGGNHDTLAVTVTAAPGTTVQNVQASNPNHTVTVTNPGPVLSRR